MQIKMSAREETPTNTVFKDKCPERENFFKYRVIPLWNFLPQEVIQAKTTNLFKNRLDNFYIKKTSLSLRSNEIRKNNILTITDT